MTKIVELIISEEQKEDQDGVFAISLVEDPAIDEYWVALSKEQKQLKFAKIDEDKRLLIAPALVPNKHIFRMADDGSDFYVWFSQDTIKKASELYMKRNHLQATTLEHEKDIDGLCVVESWIKESPIDKSVKYGFEHCPIGTWFVTMKVENDAIWNKVKDGEVLGFSIEGFFTDKMQTLSTQSTDEESKVQLIKEMIEEAETTYLASYPWEQCISDMVSEYGDKETAEKVCAAIKNRTISYSLIPKVKDIVSGERKKGD
tara:strand:- start:344 stop:1120 length:777 start_codon:yes stop_codon:yes gene_type:complete